MNDQIEAAAEALPSVGITFGPTSSSVIFALASYGALQLTHDAVSLTKKIRNNRKAKKAAKKIEIVDTPES